MNTWQTVLVMLVVFDLGFVLGAWWATRDMSAELDKLEREEEKEISRKILRGEL